MVRGRVGPEPRHLGSRTMINTMLFLQAEKKCSKPCPLKAGDVQVEQDGGAKRMWGATYAEPSAGPFRPCPMVIWGEVVTKKSEGWM